MWLANIALNSSIRAVFEILNALTHPTWMWTRVGKCELQSSRSIVRNWNFPPSILLRIPLHSIASPSSSFKLCWNQWAAAAIWPSKKPKRNELVLQWSNYRKTAKLSGFLGIVSTTHSFAAMQSLCREKCDSSSSSWWTDYLFSHLPILALQYKKVSDGLFAWRVCWVNLEQATWHAKTENGNVPH